MQIVRDAGIPIFAKPGFEADDIIATIARRVRGSGIDVAIVSKDKDLRQLIDGSTRMYDMQADTFMDADRMVQELGYGPGQAIEIQTLMGDKIDNVPGIPGVGEKTAAKLIGLYGTADAVLQHLDELTPKMRENFEKHAATLPISRQLVTLKDDIEMEFDTAACEFHGMRTDLVRGHLEALGFTTLAKKLGGGEEVAPAPVVRKPSNKPEEMGLFGSMSGDDAGTGTQPAPATPCETAADCSYHLVQTEEQFVAFLDELKQQKRFAFDTETDALGAMKSNLVGMSFSWKPKTGWYVPVLGPSDSEHLSLERVLRDLRPILENPEIKKVGHNLKYDLLMMRQVGVVVSGVALDSMVAAFLLDASRMQFGIDRLALDTFNFRKVPTSDLIGKGKDQISMQKVDLNRIAAYAAEDADIALRLADHFQAKLDEVPALKKLADEIETPLIEVLVEMEGNGIAIDPAVLKEQGKVLAIRIDELRKKISESACSDFNPDSPKQLADILFNKLKLPAGKKTKTGYSTDVEVLERLSTLHECPKLMLEYRSLTKLKNTYLDNLPEYVNDKTGRIHPSFSQIGAETGRLSCSDPNLQNIPIRTDEGRRIRLGFVPGDAKNNVLLTADYSQIELRILAHLSQEPALMKAFEADEDIHKAVASEVFSVPLDQVTKDQRGHAKTINFGIVYGVSAFGLARRIEGLTVQSAQELINSYNRRFPAIATFLNKCVMEAQTQGYVETIVGRRRPIPEIQSPILARRNASERMAINSVVQGSAADLIKIAMNNIYRRLVRERRPSRMLLQVHDELVFETPASATAEEAEMVKQEMNHAMELSVPLKVEVGWGKNWQETK